MIDTSFVETIDTSLFNTIVLVADSENSHFVNEKLKMLISENDTNLPSDIEKLTSDLSYNNINRFQVILNNRLKEIIIAGAGKKEANNRSSFEKLGGYIYDAIRNKDTTVAVLNSLESSSYENVSSYIASGLILKSWTFNKYKTKQTNQKIKSIVCKTNYKEINERSFDHLKTLIEGVFDVRRMVSEPSNFMDPAQLCEEAMSLKKFGVKVTVIDKKQMEKLDMNALLGVAKGSDNPAYVVAMEYFEGGKSDDTVALVGKGLTFDSGGLCLKPSKGMGDMKGDMTGAALVIGTLKTLALQKAKTNVVGVIGIVENMISGSAQKPGDIVTSMSGKTIEVDNTDAEGRLVLADVLWYTKEKYSPKVIVDFATLTGAIQVALGHEFAGLFSNSDALSNALLNSSNTVGEKLWRLPLHQSYEGDIKSEIADVKNVGCGRGAGSITAALFLKHFIDPGVKWAHIDIAATEWDTKTRALSQKGATGFGVRLMDDFIRNCNQLKGE